MPIGKINFTFVLLIQKLFPSLQYETIYKGNAPSERAGFFMSENFLKYGDAISRAVWSGDIPLGLFRSVI